VSAPAYDRIGRGYSAVRRPDPRLEAVIWDALGDAQTVLNIGAGAGSYEPRDRKVIAVEPSPVMIAQRPAGCAPAIQGVAESIPLADDSVDATMGVFTLQHWADLDRGLAEALRVTRERIVFLTLDVDVTAQMWLCRDYLPEIIEHDRRAFPTIAHLQAVLPDLQVEPIPVPVDCTDGFCVALWSQPEAYLDPHVRRASSTWHQLAPSIIDSALGRLRRDLDSGKWDERYGHLRTQATLDIGLRLVKTELQ
jgi:SAM-dependent methyltransferase